MYTVIVIIHLSVCAFLIFIILIQSSKGAEMGAAFGGSTQTLFGSRGAATFLNKLTTFAAVAFMLTSLSLAVLSMNRGSVISGEPALKESAVPGLPDAATGPPVGAVPDSEAEPKEQSGAAQQQAVDNPLPPSD